MTGSADGALAEVLLGRRWWRRSYPFTHVVAHDVLRPQVYDEVVDGFRALLDAGAGYLSGHGIHGRTLTRQDEGPLGLFSSRAWHDLLGRVTCVPGSGDVNVGLHHHDVGSADGFPHNDLNPAWFLEPEPGDDTGIRLAEPMMCDYLTGRVLAPTDRAPRPMVRAAAAIFYLDNPPWAPGDGGGTGVYRNASDPPRQPVAVVPPVSNSMLVFECTPFSFHGFISNRRHPRNSIVMWLHRPRSDVVRRWGEEAIVDYGH
jgi:hypothetical protein